MKKIYDIIFNLLYKLKFNLFIGMLSPRKDIIIMYHEIYDSILFENQMKYIQDNYNVINLETYIKNIKLLKYENNKKNIVITFDDGHKSTYDIAYPVLKRLNMNATIFIAPNLLSDRTDIDTNEYMNSSELIEMANSNVFEIGAHTLNHSNLGICKFNKLEYEIVEGLLELERIVNRNVNIFAYPYGKKSDYNRESIDILKKNNFICAVTTERGCNKKSNLYELNRIGVSDKDKLPTFISKLENYYPYKFTIILSNLMKKIKGAL